MKRVMFLHANEVCSPVVVVFGWWWTARADDGFFSLSSHLGLLSLPSVKAKTNQSLVFSLSLSFVTAMNTKQPKDTSAEDAFVTEPSKKTKKAFRKFSYRGVDLEKLLELKTDKLVELFCARQRRRFRRGLGRKPLALVKKLRKAKREVQGMDKPETIRTHLRNMIIVSEMIGAIVGVYNGKVFNTVEIKPEMVGTYLAEYAITYKPISHGRAGIGGESLF